MSFCATCGAQVTAGAAFCTHCGSAVEPVPGLVATGSRRPSAETIATEEQRLLKLLRDATLGEYEVAAEIGRGGMAVVYLGHDLALDRKVAIKVMSPALTLMDRGIQERFKREARTAAALSHPNIIPVFAVKETESLVFFVMKYIVGRSLESVIKEVGALAIPVVQTILGQVGAALGYAHRRGVVHRDMKPGNVMLDEEGWVVVTDFGIAKVAQAEALTATGGMVGTPAYMSPEQCAGGDVTGLADQYSLGVMAYEMLTGRQPFTSGTLVNLIYDHCHTEPPPLLEFRADCPSEIADAVMRMLAKEPAERFPTIEEAVAAISAGVETERDSVRTQLQTFVATGAAENLLEKFRTPGSPIPRSSMERRPTARRPEPSPHAAAPAPTSRMRRPVLWWGVGGVTVAALAGWFVLSQLRLTGDGAEPPPPTTAEASLPAVGRLDVTPLSAALAPGERATFRVTVLDTSGQAIVGAAVRWESSAPSVATVTSDGVAQAVAVGTAELTARSGSGSATVVVNVQRPSATPPVALPPAVATVELQPSVTALAVGETAQLQAVVRDQTGAPFTGRSTRWSTTDSAVARVTRDGMITAASVGKATIQLTVDGKVGVASVTVTAAPVATLDVAPAQTTVAAGGTVQLRATPRDRQGASLADRSVSWQSSDAVVAGVSPQGLVIGRAAGTATITAASGAARATATVVVEAVPAQPRPVVDQRPAIERVIDTYRQAIESRDLERLRAAYPGLTADQERAWREFFGNVTELSAELRIDDLQITGERATASIAATYDFRTGRRQTQHLELTATLERGPTGWRLIAIK